jgi:hypothetical protein
MGVKRAGKGETANVLHEHHGFLRMKFADPIRGLLRSLGLTEEEIDGSLKEVPCAKLGGKTPRDAMKLVGTECGRNMIWQLLWVAALERRIEGYERSEAIADCRIVVDDVRFHTEADMLRRHGAHIWHVERPGYEVPADAHQSEREHLEIESDITIWNNGDLTDLRLAVTEAVELFI